MLHFKPQGTDSIGADFGYTDNQMERFGKLVTAFFENSSDHIREDTEAGIRSTKQVERFFAHFCETFDTQELQDLFLIQALANIFSDAITNMQKESVLTDEFRKILEELRSTDEEDFEDKDPDWELEDLI